MTITDVRPSARGLVIVAAGFALVTIVLTYPQIKYLTTHVGAHPDAVFTVWRFAWIAHQLALDPGHLFDANIFYPQQATLAYGDMVLLPGLMLAPLGWLGVQPVTIYNLALLATFVLSATAGAFLGWRLTGRPEAGVIAGLIFAFAPHRFGQYTHFEVEVTWWMPLAFLALQEALATARPRSYASLALWVSFQVLSCIYNALLLLVCLAGAAATAIGTRQAARSWRHWRGLAWLLVAAAVFVLYSVPYRQSRATVGERQRPEIAQYSALPVNFLAADPTNVLYGALAARFGQPERCLFPGLIALTLAAIGAFSPRRGVVIVWLVTLAVAIDLCLGLNGLLYPVLYERVEAFHALRVPARAATLVLLSLAALASLGVELICRKLTPQLRPVVLAVLVLGLVVEYRPRLALAEVQKPAPAYRILRYLSVRAVLEMPVTTPDRLGVNPDALYMYHSTSHWKKLVNGYSGFFPPEYIQTLEDLRSFPMPHSLGRVEAIGVTHLILHREGWTGRLDYDATILALHDLGAPLILKQRDIAIFSLPRSAKS